MMLWSIVIGGNENESNEGYYIGKLSPKIYFICKMIKIYNYHTH